MGSARTVFVEATRSPSHAPTREPAAVRLIMLGPDGQPMGERLLQNEVMPVGRDAGPPWEDDAYLDPVHATLKPDPIGLEVEDHRSLNGIYYRLSGRTELRDGDEFRVGQELLRYEDLPEPAPTADRTERMGSPNPGYWGRLSVLVEPDRPSKAFPIRDAVFNIGRETGDLLFPEDGYVSGTHCRISADESGVYLEDLNSSNGTYVRVRNGDVVPFRTVVLIGQRLFQLEPGS